MSHHLSNQAWEIELRTFQKIVLLALSHLATLSTRECTPTIQRRAFMCGMSDSGVRAQIVDLVKAGLVEEVGDGARRAYRVRIGRVTDGETA